MEPRAGLSLGERVSIIAIDVEAPPVDVPRIEDVHQLVGALVDGFPHRFAVSGMGTPPHRFHVEIDRYLFELTKGREISALLRGEPDCIFLHERHLCDTKGKHNLTGRDLFSGWHATIL
jgi:hypothetical protein